MGERGFSGLNIDSDEWRYPASLPYSLLEDETLTVRHWHPNGSITYNGYGSFLFGTATALSRRIRIKDRFLQKIFNVRTRFRHERIEILKKLVELDLRDFHDELFTYSRAKHNKYMLFADLYGYRVYDHPNFKLEERRFNLVIESLTCSGELCLEEDLVFLSGKSLETISKYEAEERRHFDNKLQNWLISILTAIIAFSGLLN